jgi:glutaredoxin
MSHYYLFSTSGCHLCEQAEALLQNLPLALDYRIQEITENNQWLEQYSIRIPVLYHPDSGDELGWPFDQALLLEFINRHSPVENHDPDS